MKRHRISMLAMLCATALGAAGANAHETKPGYTHNTPGAQCGWPHGPFMQVDSNGDGYIDRVEVPAASPWYPYYGAIDANRDGRISRAEADAYTSAYRPDVWPYGTFVQVDTNGDGFVDRTEVVDTSPWYPHYSSLDANGDGRITRAEADAYTTTWRGDGWPYGSFVTVDTNGDGFADRTEVVATSPWYPYYGAIDTNRDGRISRMEADAYTMGWRRDRWPFGTFVQVDTNGDGFVDRTEVVETSPWYPYYTGFDANGDGRISRAEADTYIAGYRPSPWAGWTYVGADTNRDGFIDRTEVVATSPLDPHFDSIDTNDDARVTQEELNVFWRTMAYTSHGACGAMMAHDDPGADAPRDTSDKGPPPSFRSSDKNGDGFLARDELAPGDMLLGHFNAADSNNDGRLSAGEVDAHHAAMASMGKK
jgi:hypothetical protein